MSPQLVFLDESSTNAKWHRILSVGGVSVAAQDLADVEARWREAKKDLSLAERDLRYAMSWPGGSAQRLQMIEVVRHLPLRQGVIALLEDFRPKRMRLSVDREKRSDLYVHRGCFEYVLQRLCAPQYRPPDEGIHTIVFDHGDHIPKLDKQYRAVHGQSWQAPWGFPSLLDCGYSESLTSACGGPLIEIADLVVGALTRWAACRCGEDRGKNIPERAELDRACQALIHLFPTKPHTVPPRYSGWSIVVHAKNLTGKEQLKESLDRWLDELESADAAPS